MQSVTVVMPVYNEALLLDSAVATTTEFLKARPQWDFEILVVESGSTDGTDRIAEEIGSANPSVRVIHEGARRGFGSGLRLGYAHAQKEWVWLVTADLPFPLDALDQAAPYLADHDAILSFRSSDDRPAWRRLQSVLYNCLSKAILRLPFRSVNSAFKLLRRDLLQTLSLEENGWLIDAEILQGIHRLDARWTEIPVPLRERTAGRSTVGVATSLAVFVELVRFRLRRRA